MKEEKISTTGAFVECGRSDLVGKYVGWTAKIVKEKFKEASGGILFIDEAYSLLDDSNSFGAEAINTIVQEMENHRDDVLVIFAGYPDMMNDFIDSNAGLRSRIAFHVDFPDYDVDELNEILCVMAKDRGYRLNQGIRKKCRGIFADVVKEKNFGNGRYVRNLLDAAILHQAERLMRTGQNITRQKAYCLTMEDFHKVSITTRKPKLHMGFQKRYASDDSTDI
jgi:SpoVK/Ycf46/Vps4 family AAA+-type ATPase